MSNVFATRKTKRRKANLARGLRRAASECKPKSQEVFKLHGLYFFNPKTSGPAHFQKFLWSGLQVLAREVERRGLPAEDRARLLSTAFDRLHDESRSLWDQVVHHAAHAQLQSSASSRHSDNVPVADFYEPASFGWTPAGYEVREALKQFSEGTNANH